MIFKYKDKVEVINHKFFTGLKGVISSWTKDSYGIKLDEDTFIWVKENQVCKK